jgi:glycosyltransferase involved in cell wall biosynthesis
MSSLPRISIVTPSYQQAPYLERTLRSVLEQGYADLDYIVMDGGSKDGSLEIIQRYASRLSYWQSQPDGGQAAAIRAGFGRATGEVMGWLNSDDVLLPGALQAVGAYFASHPQVECATGGGLYIDEEGLPSPHRRMNFSRGVRSTYDRLLHYEPQEGVFQQSTFWRRAAYDAVGGVDASFQYTMDLDLLLRLTQRQPLQRIPAWVGAFRWHGTNKTHSLPEVLERELARLYQMHGVVQPPRGLDRLKGMAYGAQTLLRKTAWTAARGVGLLRLPDARWQLKP